MCENEQLDKHKHTLDILNMSGDDTEEAEEQEEEDEKEDDNGTVQNMSKLNIK